MSPDVDRIAELERRVALLEAFVDSEHREKMGLTLDEIRAIWCRIRGGPSAD